MPPNDACMQYAKALLTLQQGFFGFLARGNIGKRAYNLYDFSILPQQRLCVYQCPGIAVMPGVVKPITIPRMACFCRVAWMIG